VSDSSDRPTAQNPYAAPRSDAKPASAPPLATLHEMRASAFATYYYFLVAERAFGVAILFGTGVKRSAAARAILITLEIFFGRALYLAGRAVRSLRPNYLVFMRNTLFYAVCWVAIYGSRAVNVRPTLDVVVAVTRLALLAAMYFWAHARTLDGSLQPRMNGTALPQWRSFAIGLIALHLGSYAVGFAILHH